jgi:hypothetical protein
LTQVGDPDNRITAAGVCQEISSVVWEQPYLNFRQVVEFIRRDLGLSRRSLLSRFRWARRVFNDTKREARQHARAKAKMMAKRQELARAVSVSKCRLDERHHRFSQ